MVRAIGRVARVHREIATPAFVLRTRPYGESDRIVTFITEQHGKLTGIAKGAKNSRRRFAGTLEPFVHVRVVFRQRPTSDLAFLLRCELLGALRALHPRPRPLRRRQLRARADRPHGARPRVRRRGLPRWCTRRSALLDARAPPRPAAARLRAAPPRGQRLRAGARPLPRLRRAGRRPTPCTCASSAAASLCRRCVRAGEPVRPVAAATALRARPARAGAARRRGRRARMSRARRGARASPSSCSPAVTSGPVRSRALPRRARVDSPDGRPLGSPPFLARRIDGTTAGKTAARSRAPARASRPAKRAALRLRVRRRHAPTAAPT